MLIIVFVVLCYGTSWRGTIRKYENSDGFVGNRLATLNTLLVVADRITQSRYAPINHFSLDTTNHY